MQAQSTVVVFLMARFSPTLHIQKDSKNNQIHYLEIKMNKVYYIPFSILVASSFINHYPFHTKFI